MNTKISAGVPECRREYTRFTVKLMTNQTQAKNYDCFQTQRYHELLKVAVCPAE